MAKHARLIRHAESAANAGLPTDAPDSIPLTEHGRSQAQDVARSIAGRPDLIIASPFERAVDTATPTVQRYPEVPFEIWPVEEFTYLSPARFVGTTQAERRPVVDAYWNEGSQSRTDGPGAESFAQLLERAKAMLHRLEHHEADRVVIFSHGQFIRAVAWLIQHAGAAGSPEMMRGFRALDVAQPLLNCAGYEISFSEGRWTVEYALSQDATAHSHDRFCTDSQAKSAAV